jgi:hypothetical protein
MDRHRQGVTIGQMGAEPGQEPTPLPEMFGGVAADRAGADRHADAMRGHVARHAAAEGGRASVAAAVGNAAEDLEAAYRRGVEDGRAEVRADVIRRLGLVA